VYADAFAQFGSLDLDLGDDRPTWPSPDSAFLKIEDKFEPLFTSVTWTIIAKSTEKDKAHTEPFISSDGLGS